MIFEQRFEGIEGAYCGILHLLFFCLMVYTEDLSIVVNRELLHSLIIALYSMLCMYHTLFNQMTLDLIFFKLQIMLQ